MHALAEIAKNAHIVGAAGEGVHARRSCKRRTNVEIRYHGPFVPSFLGMALWIEGSNGFKLRVPMRTYKAQYHVHNKYNGFHDTLREATGRGWGRGLPALGAS